MNIKFKNTELTEFDKELFEELSQIYALAKASGDILSETRMARALYAFTLPPDKCCIIREARKNDIVESKYIN